MMSKVKRKDNTDKLMRGIQKATEESLSESAIKLKAISRKMVSRPYTGKRRPNGNEEEDRQS